MGGAGERQLEPPEVVGREERQRGSHPLHLLGVGEALEDLGDDEVGDHDGRAAEDLVEVVGLRRGVPPAPGGGLHS